MIVTGTHHRQVGEVLSSFQSGCQWLSKKNIIKVDEHRSTGDIRGTSPTMDLKRDKIIHIKVDRSKIISNLFTHWFAALLLALLGTNPSDNHHL